MTRLFRGARRQVSFNHLTGTIPATWGASNATGFYALRYLDLRGNMLVGTLPPGLGNTLNLLPGNAFCGAIPANATICQRRAFCDPAQISYFCSCGDSLSALPDCAGGRRALEGWGCRPIASLPSAFGQSCLQCADTWLMFWDCKDARQDRCLVLD